MISLFSSAADVVSGAIHILSDPSSVRHISSVRQLLLKRYLLPQFLSEFNETWESCRKQFWLKKFGSGILNFCLSQIWRVPKVEVPKLPIFATFSWFSQRFWMMRPWIFVQRFFLTLLMLPKSQISKILKIGILAEF